MEAAQVAMATLVHDFLGDIDTRVGTGELNVRIFSRMNDGEVQILLTLIIEDCAKENLRGGLDHLHNILVKVLHKVVSNSDKRMTMCWLMSP